MPHRWLEPVARDSWCIDCGRFICYDDGDCPVAGSGEWNPDTEEGRLNCWKALGHEPSPSPPSR